MLSHNQKEYATMVAGATFLGRFYLAGAAARGRAGKRASVVAPAGSGARPGPSQRHRFFRLR